MLIIDSLSSSSGLPTNCLRGHGDGELRESRLAHREQAEQFYRELRQRDGPVPPPGPFSLIFTPDLVLLLPFSDQNSDPAYMFRFGLYPFRCIQCGRE